MELFFPSINTNQRKLVATIKRYVQVYNQHIPQKALGHIPPLQAMKNWYQKQPNLFKKRVYNLPGLAVTTKLYTRSPWIPGRYTLKRNYPLSDFGLMRT